MLKANRRERRGHWSEAALKVLRERYLSRHADGSYESPEEMCWRVARAIAEAELRWGKSEQEVLEISGAFADLMIDDLFVPNSPTLMNAGKENGLQFSACYVLPVDDSLDDIFESVKRAALIHKSGGGCIAGDARVWTTFCGIEPIAVLVNRATADGRTGVRIGSGTAYDVSDLGIRTLSMNPATGEPALGDVTHVWRFDVPAESQVVVTLREGTVVQTSDWHPFMVLRGTRFAEVPAAELRPGDVMLGPGRTDSFWPWREQRKVGSLTVDDDLGWLIGFTLGDGSFEYVPSLRQYRVRWFAGEADVLERARAVLARQGISVSLQEDGRGLFSVATLNQRFAHDLLEACGLEKIGQEDGLIRVPEVIAKSPLPVVRAFLAGLLDGDGYGAPDGSPSYATTSQAMAEDVAALLSLLGYQPTLKAKAPRGKGRRTTYTVQFCPLPQVGELADDLSPYQARAFRRAHLGRGSRKQTALRLPFAEWRDRLASLGLVNARGDERHGSGPCASELSRWAANPAGRCLRDDLKTIATVVEECDRELAALLRRLAESGKEVAHITRAAVPKPYYDLTVEGWNTYAAGASGLAMIHNTGFAFSRLRSKDSTVHSTGGKASGPVSFMRVFNSATEAVKQGGTRRGANMGVLRVDHPDILEFIDCKLDGSITNFNISVAITDRFMQAVADDGEYDLVAPDTGAGVERRRAREVLERIVRAAWQTGDPGLIFIDRVNASPANPTPEVGQVEATNPCGEQPLLPNEACNLGSINLVRFALKQSGRKSNGRAPLDWEELERVVRLAVRFLDDVIEVNPYPLKEIDEMVKSNRRIGLGVMGWADLLVVLGIPYDSEEALALAGEIMSFIQRIGHDESVKLAVERGPFPNWGRSIYRKGRPIRNATVTTIAPTGTISIISGCSSGIEPLFALAFSHIVGERHLTFVNPYFEEFARERGFYGEELMRKVAQRGTVHGVAEVPPEARRILVTAHEVEPEWHVRMQAAFQKYTDNGVSKTINLPNSATIEDVARAYRLAYEAGCLGITVFRDGCKGTQVLHVGATSGSAEGKPEGKEQGDQEEKAGQAKTSPEPTGEKKPTLKPRPHVVHGTTYRRRTPMGTAFVTVNRNGNNEPFEVFTNVGKAGSDTAAVSEAIGRLISLCLRLPSPLTPTERLGEIVGQLSGIGGGRSLGFGKGRVRSLPDAIAQVLAEEIGLGEDALLAVAEPEEQMKIGDLCPECGHATLVFEEGCQKCYSCGFSEC